MRDRLLKSAAVALTVTAITVPLAHATSPDDGYKSGYPQLHAIHTYKQTSLGRGEHRRGLQVRIPATPRNPHLQRTNPSDPDDQSQLPLERRGHRRWNSSRSNIPRSRRRPRPQPPPHQDRRLRRANQPRESPIDAPPPVGRGTSRISSPSTQTPM